MKKAVPVLAVAVVALAFAGVATAATVKDAPPAPTGLRAMLKEGGYPRLIGVVANGMRIYIAAKGDHRHGRVALQLANDGEAMLAVFALRTMGDKKQQMEAKIRSWGFRTATINRSRTWHRYLVLDFTARK